MPLVMLSSRRMLTSFHAGYCGSHLPIVSSMDSFAGSLQFQDHGGSKGLRRAAHLEQCVLAHRRILWRGADFPGERLDRRARVAEADVGGNAGDLFRHRPFRDPCFQGRLDLRGPACAPPACGRRREERHAQCDRQCDQAAANLHHALPRPWMVSNVASRLPTSTFVNARFRPDARCSLSPAIVPLGWVPDAGRRQRIQPLSTDALAP